MSGRLQDYFCEHCNERVEPYDLEANNKDHKNVWSHKKCKQKKIIRVDLLPEVPSSVEDLFE